MYEAALHSYWPVSFFWLTCHFVINLVLRSILAGMIWEVFIVVSKTKEDEDEDLTEKLVNVK